MTLRELLTLCDSDMIIHQGTKLGTSGSSPVGHYHLTNPVPQYLMDREIKHFQPAPREKYGRPSACLVVHLKGYVEY